MIEEVKSIKNKKIEQMIIERPIKINIPKHWEGQDDVRLYRDDSWTPIIWDGNVYSLKQLLKEGWIVKSIEKSFCSKEDAHFGYETAILERNISND